jgi:hypothetical protein
MDYCSASPGSSDLNLSVAMARAAAIVTGVDGHGDGCEAQKTLEFESGFAARINASLAECCRRASGDV